MGFLSKVKGFFTGLEVVKEFNNLEDQYKKIVFYAESKNDWLYFEGIIEYFLEQGETLTYISSDPHDSIFEIENEKVKKFLIEGESLLTIFFKQLNCKNLIMTLPDLESFSLKRSSVAPVQYIYMFHSIVSTHMIYRHQAFDAYDVLLTVGPHHDKEIRESEESYGLNEKMIIPYGYYRLEKLTKEVEEFKNQKVEENQIIIAPSWGDQSLLNLYLDEIVAVFKSSKYSIVIRPHPMTLKDEKIKNKIIDICEKNENFIINDDIRDISYLESSSIMISDWSGVALEYSFSYERPLVFIDTPPKVNNENFKDFTCKPLEVEIREKIGTLVNATNLDSLVNVLDELISNRDRYKENIRKERNTALYNFGESSQIGGANVLALINTGASK